MPVTIIGGYLGSGKTTLVNHLLRNANGKRLAILVNEFGELPIDADLIEAQDDDIISLSGGCVCCSYGNDLIMAMMDMAKMDPRPDHIVLEASGVALPGAIANSLSLLQDYSLDGIVVLADAETIQSRANDKYMSDTILRQLDDANILLLNKTDLVSDDNKQATISWLSQKTNGAAIVETQNSTVSPDIILQSFLDVGQPSKSMKPHAVGNFETRSIKMDGPVDANTLAHKLAQERTDIIRAKGFVCDLDGMMKTLQIVGQRAEITPAPNAVAPGLVVIGTKPLSIDELI